MLLAQHFGLENVADVNPNLHDKKNGQLSGRFFFTESIPDKIIWSF
jgi:hypothetical protein